MMFTKTIQKSVILFAFTIAIYPHVLVGQETGTQEYQQAVKTISEMLDKVPDGGESGEPIAWYWNWQLAIILDHCQRNPTETVLGETEKVLNTLLDKMAVGPDGYKGFIGPYIYVEKEYACDVHVSDAILIDHALTFAMIVHDRPELRDKYAESTKRFLATAKRDLIEKWNKRGTFVEDGPFGGFREWDHYCKPGDLENWFQKEVVRPNGLPNPALPFNKSLHIAHCMLKIYYLTGEKEYKNQAEKIYNRVKAAMNPFQGGYTWCYWEPLSSQDILDKDNGQFDLTHWVGTHPYRDYQDGEMKMIVFAYNMGVTFTEADIRRFIHTNLKFMWNGDMNDPQWANSNSKLPGYTKAEPSTTYPTTAGTVWSALGQFDSTIQQLSVKMKKRGATDLAEPTFKRKYASDATVEEFPWRNGIAESGGQFVAIAIPSVVNESESAVLISKASPKRSKAEVYVKPLDGEEMTLLTTLNQGDDVQMYYVWDGKINGKRTPGEYVIVWKYLDGQRAYPVTLK